MSKKNPADSIKVLFYRSPLNIARSFWKFNLALHLAAIFLTYIMVTSGFDRAFFDSARNALYFQTILFPAVMLGGLVPIIVPVALYFIGRKRNKPRTTNTAFALGQAVIISMVVSSVYKAMTGRVPPQEFFRNGPLPDISGEFQFGFLRGGIFNGWPSGHATTAFAMALVLIKLYPDNKRIRYLALAYAIYVGFGISTNIHWFSDFVAGIFIGTGIGLTVGKSFWERYCSETVR